MARPRRLLTVEPFEERVLPSVSFFPVGHEAARSQTAIVRMPVKEAGENFAVTAWTGRIFTPDGVIHFRLEIWTRVISPMPGGYLRGEAAQAGSGRAEVPADRGGSADEGPFASASAVSAASPAGGGGRAASGQGAGPVSLAIPPAATPPAAAAAASAAAPDVRPPAPTASLILPAVAAPIFSSRVSYPLLAGLFPAVGSAPDLVPAPEPTPDPAQPPAEPAPADGLSVARLAAAAVEGLPLGAAVAVDAAALATSAAHFLDRVTDLGAEWPDDLPDFEDYAWTAVAVLLAGAAIHTALTRKADRRPRDVLGIDSVLAQREGWDGRRSG